MSLHEANKKANRQQFSNKESCCSFGDAGSSTSGSSASCKTNANAHNKRKPIVTKDLAAKTRNVNKSSAVPQRQNDVENDNQALQRMEPLSILVNEVFKIHGTISKERIQAEKLSNSDGVIRDNVDNKTTNIPICHSFESNCLDAKVVEQDTTACSSFVGESGKILSLAQFADKTSPSTPSLSLNFGDINSTPCKGDVDYLKEFNSFLNDSPFNQFETAKGVYSNAANTSSLSKPIILKRRTCRGILSVNDSVAPPSKIRENNASCKTTVESEHGDNDAYYSGEEYSEASICSEDSVFVGDDNELCPPGPEKQSTFLINEPIRVKFIDEATKHASELVIYTDEYLTNLFKETGSMVSEKEVFETLLSHCQVYESKSLRMITDIEKFICNLNACSKSQGDITLDSSTELTKEISRKASRRKNPKKGVPSASGKRCGNSPNEESLNEGKKPIVQKFYKKKRFEKKTSTPKKRPFLGVDIPYTVNCKESKGICFKRFESSDAESGKKSRNALKRVNVEEIISSAFKHHFSFYAKLGSRLKSGFAISRNNSNFWLKTCGIISDDESEKVADDCFHAATGMKCVLNIRDYIQYLMTLARKQRLFPLDVVQQLMSTNALSQTKLKCELDTNHSPDQ